MLNASVPAGSGRNNGQEIKNGNMLFSAVSAWAGAAAPLFSFCKTASRGDPSSVCRSLHSAARLCESRSARIATTRSALSICSIFSCGCGAMESTSTFNPVLPPWNRIYASCLQRQYSQERDAHPRRPAVHLVKNLIERLIQEEDIQQFAKIARVSRQELLASSRLTISPQKFRGDRVLPEPRPGFETGEISGMPGSVV